MTYKRQTLNEFPKFKMLLSVIAKLYEQQQLQQQQQQQQQQHQQQEQQQLIHQMQQQLQPQQMHQMQPYDLSLKSRPKQEDDSALSPKCEHHNFSLSHNNLSSHNYHHHHHHSHSHNHSHHHHHEPDSADSLDLVKRNSLSIDGYSPVSVSSPLSVNSATSDHSPIHYNADELMLSEHLDALSPSHSHSQQPFKIIRDKENNFICQYCDKKYQSMGAIKMHVRTHTLPCQCKICGKSFSRPWLLQGHIRTHTGEKPFKCDQCHRAFADRSNLRAHLQTHQKVKKYQCKCCQKTFSRMSLQVKHEEHCNSTATATTTNDNNNPAKLVSA